ncbi:hypothetical protein FGG08_001968 [Glutinoglossum americanum]|uniref:Uncharacterized protein n=1 Tax=Glutinoglossum americanum TaxID=1670608 RepID=A0A9P8I7A7_9PEZI|nr:hypothetical protein FGG08_001968 [Glutinoglossum americanum]
MGAVEPCVVSAWVKANGRTMRKLYEKALRTGITGLLQFAYCFEEDFISEALRITLTAVIQPETNMLYLSRLRDCQTFLDGINEATEDSPTFRKGLFSAISTNEFAKPLRAFCEVSIPERRLADGCATLKLCWRELQESRRRLAASFCLLVLKAALHSSGDNIGLETSLGLSLLGKHRDVATPMAPCTSARHHCTSVETPSVTLLEQKSTPQDVRTSHEWKRRLAEILMRDATQRHELIVNTVSDVCRELEERCENVERPLREVQAELGSVQSCLGESKQRIDTLEVEASERELYLDGLDAEKLRLESQVSSLFQRAQDLEHLLQQATNETHNTKAAADEAKKLELNHLAILAIKDESIVELEQNIERLEQEFKGLNDELSLARRENSEDRENLVVLRKQLEERKTELEQEKAAGFLKHIEIENLNSLNEALRTNIKVLNHDLRESSVRVEELRSKFRETQKTLSCELESVRQSRETDASEAAAQAAKASHLHSREIDELRALLRDAQHDLSLERQKGELKVLELEKEIKQMYSEREERAKEFLHAQDLSRRLMAVMGAGSAVPRSPNLAIGKKGTSGTPTDNQEDHRGDKRTKTSHGGNDNRGGDGMNTGSLGSGSPTRNGRTPKRSRTRSQGKPPLASQQTKAKAKTKVIKPIEGQDREKKRSPLKELAIGNHSAPLTATSQDACHSPDSQRGWLSRAGNLHLGLGMELADIEDFSFDDSEFATSTQTHRHDQNQQLTNTNIFDDSTAEF